MALLRAYVQSDWSAAQACPEASASSTRGFEDLLILLKTYGIENTATWHIKATGAQYLDKVSPKCEDAVRNTREINASDAVITVCCRQNPEFKFWGSLALMSYALGAGKQVYLVAKPDCIIWKNHIVHHPNVHRFYDLDEFFTFLTR